MTTKAWRLHCYNILKGYMPVSSFTQYSDGQLAQACKEVNPGKFEHLKRERNRDLERTRDSYSYRDRYCNQDWGWDAREEAVLTARNNNMILRWLKDHDNATSEPTDSEGNLIGGYIDAESTL